MTWVKFNLDDLMAYKQTNIGTSVIKQCKCLKKLTVSIDKSKGNVANGAKEEASAERDLPSYSVQDQ